jgi:hypothetical protein
VFYRTICAKNWKLTTKGVTKCQIKKTIVNKAADNKVVVKVAKLEEASRAAKAGSLPAASKVVVKVARLEEVSRAGRLVKTAERNRVYLIRCRDSILGTILKQPYIQEAVIKGFIVGLVVGLAVGIAV